MSITSGVISGMEAAMKAAMGDLLSPQQVDPYDGQPSVSVKLHVGTRRANESEITAGATQDTNLVATIDYDDWMAKVGREPQRGDVIWWMGKRHAVDRSVNAAPAGNGVFFKARLQG